MERELIFHNVTTLCFNWDDKLPENMMKDWSAWVELIKSAAELLI